VTDSVLSLLRGAYVGSFIGGFVFFLLWEAAKPRCPFADANERRRHVLRNLGCLALIIVFADIVFGQLLLRTYSLLAAVPAGLLTPLELHWSVQLAFGIVALDLLVYGWHRLTHAVPLLWRLHRVHHTDTHLDVTTAARFHPLETCANIALVVGVLMALGIPLWVELARTLVVQPLLMAQHANVDMGGRWERALRWLLVTPALHRLHHSPLRAEHDANYGQIFSCWDRWLGTLRAPPSAAGRVGLDGFEADRWQSVAGMMATPLAPSARPLRTRQPG